MSPHHPGVPANTGTEQQYRIAYFRPIADPCRMNNMAFIENVRIVGLKAVATQDIPENVSISEYCKATPRDMGIEALAKQFCEDQRKVRPDWTLVAELDAMHLRFYWRGSVTPVIAVLLTRPNRQAPSKAGGSKKSLRHMIRSKLGKWTGSAIGGHEEVSEVNDRQPLLG